MASYSVNERGVAPARRLIDARQYVLGSDRGEVQPKAAAGIPEAASFAVAKGGRQPRVGRGRLRAVGAFNPGRAPVSMREIASALQRSVAGWRTGEIIRHGDQPTSTRGPIGGRRARSGQRLRACQKPRRAQRRRRYSFLLDGEWITAGQGDFVNVPRGAAHRFYNQGTAATRMILTFTPAGIEKFFEETLQQTLDPTADIPDNVDVVAARYAAAAPRYGIEFIVG